MEQHKYRQVLIDKMGAMVEQKDVILRDQSWEGEIKTAYLSSGEGEVVICLHGAGAGAVTWYPAVEALAKQFHVIVPDIVGYGESDKPDGSYDRPYFVTWLRTFLDALSISKAHIIGLSQGGAIALQFAIDCPERVDKLALVNSAALGAKPSLGALFSMILLNAFPSGLTNNLYAPYILHAPEQRDPNHSRYSVAVIKSQGGKNAFRQGRGAAVAAIPHDALTKVQQQTLIIWGEKDRLFPIEYGEKAAQIIPNAQLKSIPNAGHLSLIDQPDIFNRILLDFLSLGRN